MPPPPAPLSDTASVPPSSALVELDLQPEFAADVLTYRVEVPFDVSAVRFVRPPSRRKPPSLQ